MVKKKNKLAIEQEADEVDWLFQALHQRFSPEMLANKPSEKDQAKQTSASKIEGENAG